MARRTSRFRRPRVPDAAPADVLWLGLAWLSAVLFALLALDAAGRETPTVDEFAHLPSGCASLWHGRHDLYHKNPPLGKLALAAPLLLVGADVPPLARRGTAWDAWQYGYDFLDANLDDYFRLFLSARLVSIAAGLLSGWLLYRWTRRLYGPCAAAGVAAMFFLSPTVLAHAHLATVDAGCMLTVLLSIVTLLWACRQPSWKRFAAAGLAWGAALAVKFTALLLVPLVIVLPFFCRARRQWPLAAAEALLVGLVALLSVNAVMGFQGSFSRVGQFTLVSQAGRRAAAWLPAALPLPLPYDYVAGLDAQARDAETGEYGTYLLGRWSREGRWYYYLVAMAVKTPVIQLLLLVAGITALVRRPLPGAETLAIALPAVALFAALMFFNRLNLGIRYLLPVYPLLLLVMGAAWRLLADAWQARLTWLAAGMHAAMLPLMHPEYLGYFNLASGGPAAGHRWLIDSNLDWGQDLYRLAPAVRSLEADQPVWLLYFGHVPPEMYGIAYALVPDEPVEGIVAVSVNYLMGAEYPALAPDGQLVPIRRGHLDWLHRYEPVGSVGSIWIFDTRRPTGPAG